MSHEIELFGFGHRAWPEPTTVMEIGCKAKYAERHSYGRIAS